MALALRRISAAHWPGQVQKRSAAAWNGVTPGYEGATQGRRTAGWNPGNDSVNSLLFQATDHLRARSRDAVRKNAWASNASETFVSEAIGSGIKPQSQHPDTDIKAELQQLWLDWTDYCDAHGTQDFYGLQSLAMRSIVEGGECFVRYRLRKPIDNLTVPLQLQLLEAEHCPATKNERLENGNWIKAGIEFNQIGQRVAYWLYPVHPGERGAFAFTDPTLDPVRVPASQVLHLFRPTRPGQIRGEPWLSRALVRLFDYDQYTDAELMRKKVAALFAGFIVQQNADDLVVAPTPAGLPAIEGEPAKPERQAVATVSLEPGSLQSLEPGEDVKFSNPADVGPGFEAFNRACLREIAASIGLTYEQLSNDLSGVNYSSIRAGLLAFRRKVEQIQHQVVVFQFCRPVWRQWLESAVFAGEIRARDYQRNKAAYVRVKWIAPGWTWVDPLKEVLAGKAAVRCGVKSLPQWVSESGYDIEEVLQETAQAYKLADRLGIVLDTDARQTADSGMRPSGRDPNNPDGLQDIDEPEQDLPEPTKSTTSQPSQTTR